MSKIKGLPYCKESSDRKKYLSRISKSLYYGKIPQYDSLSIPLTEFSIELFSNVKKGKSVDRLHYNDAVNISYNACVSPCSLILAMLYIDKLKENNPEYLERTPTADLFLVSLMISSKFLFDDGECDEVFIDSWATSGGLTTSELVALEREFLRAIDWRLFASDKKFFEKLGYVERNLAKVQGESRGYFTYTELEKLLGTCEICDIFKGIICVSAILAATYTVGVLTILGSVFLTSKIPGTSLYVSKVEIGRNETIPISHDRIFEGETGCLIGNCTDNVDLFNFDKMISEYKFASTVPFANNNYLMYETFQREIDEEFEGEIGYVIKTKLDKHFQSLWYKTIKL